MGPGQKAGPFFIRLIRDGRDEAALDNPSWPSDRAPCRICGRDRVWAALALFQQGDL
jgi:hypothetical protein